MKGPKLELSELRTELRDKLQGDVPFAFSRWGDGEWIAIRGAPRAQTNADGNHYFPALGKRLKKIAQHKQSYYMGCQWGRLFSLRGKYNQDWVQGDIFHTDSKRSNLKWFLDLLNSKHVLYAANPSLKELPFIDEFVNMGYKDIWPLYTKKLSQLKEALKAVKSPSVCLISAGMAAGVFIDDLWRWNKNITYIDVGSVFEPYAGRLTRGYHKGGFEKIKEGITYLEKISKK